MSRRRRIDDAGNEFEIPYFGEHTQITVICESCGWKHTDFIPSDGEKPGYSSLIVDEPEKCSARVVDLHPALSGYLN